MKESVLQAIIAFVFGHKYYANIVNTRGVDKCELTSFIFRTREQAEKHRKQLDATLTYQFVETVTFRSRKEY